MAKIDFYYMAESPPCRVVEMVANMIGVKLEKHSINLFTKEHMNEDYIKLNPMHRVPFIVDGGLKINESRAIICYLVNKYKPENNSLYPRDPVKRARIDELLYYDIGTFYQSGSNLLRPLLFGKSKELDPEAEKTFREVLKFLDSKLEKGSKFLLGDEITIADVSISSGLSFIECFDYSLDDFKSVKAYFQRLKTAIPDYAEINEKPCENMRKFIESKRQ